VLLAFLVGAAAGAAVALLYAPAAGRDTRELLGEKSREGREKAAALAEKGRQAINDSREKAAALAEKGRQAINDSRETLTSAIERGREAYEQARSREKA
jgi:gas vesicle protein